jgi:hypothetical protein
MDDYAPPTQMSQRMLESLMGMSPPSNSSSDRTHVRKTTRQRIHGDQLIIMEDDLRDFSGAPHSPLSSTTMDSSHVYYCGPSIHNVLIQGTLHGRDVLQDKYGSTIQRNHLHFTCMPLQACHNVHTLTLRNTCALSIHEVARLIRSMPRLEHVTLQHVIFMEESSAGIHELARALRHVPRLQTLTWQGFSKAYLDGCYDVVLESLACHCPSLEYISFAPSDSPVILQGLPRSNSDPPVTSFDRIFQQSSSSTTSSLLCVKLLHYSRKCRPSDRSDYGCEHSLFIPIHQSRLVSDTLSAVDYQTCPSQSDVETHEDDDDSALWALERTVCDYCEIWVHAVRPWTMLPPSMWASFFEHVVLTDGHSKQHCDATSVHVLLLEQDPGTGILSRSHDAH